MTRNTTIISVSLGNDTLEAMFEVMHRIDEGNASQYVRSAVEHYNKLQKEELDRKDKTKFMLERAKPLIKDFFRSIRVDHIPDEYVFATEGSLEKIQKFLKKNGVEIDIQIVKDAIIELTMEESQ
jgi:hypothetical protein